MTWRSVFGATSPTPDLFEIDYYDLALQFHSPDASNPAVTQRVMAVMLADEY